MGFDQKNRNDANAVGSNRDSLWQGKPSDQAQNVANRPGLSSFWGSGDRDAASAAGANQSKNEYSTSASASSNFAGDLFAGFVESIKRMASGGNPDPQTPVEAPKVDPQVKAANDEKAKIRKANEQRDQRDQRRSVRGMDLRADPQMKQKISTEMIQSEYVKDADLKDLPKKDPTSKVGNMGTKDEKIEYLKTLTQQDSSDPAKEANKDYCGPTTMIAAAMYLDGPKGLSPLLNKMQNDVKKWKDPEEQAKYTIKMKEIQEKINSNELTNGDVDTMKSLLYGTMHAKQELDPKLTEKQQMATGVHEKIMREYLVESGMLERMKKEKMSIRNIDNDGDGEVNHYFMRIGNESAGLNPIIYDPYARKNGQTIDGNSPESDQVQDYHGLPYHDLGFEEVPQASTPRKK